MLYYLLVRRKNNLIDLGIARYGQSSVAIRRVFNRGNSGVRCAVLSGRYYFLLKEEVKKNIIHHGTNAELESLIKNRFLGNDILEDFLNRKGEFSNFPDAKFASLLELLGANPRMSAKYDGPYDGWAESRHDQVFSLAWELPRHLPTTNKNAYVLYELLRHTKVPYNYDNPYEVIDRWRIDDDAKVEGYSVPYSYFLRTCIADVLKPDEKLLESSDPALRESFYRRFSPWKFDCSVFIGQDGELAFDAMVQNDEFWRNEATRKVLNKLAWEVPDPNSNMNALNLYKAIEERNRSEHPKWFIEEDSEFSNSPSAIEQRIENKLEVVVDSIEALSEKGNQANDDSMDIQENIKTLLEKTENRIANIKNELRQEFNEFLETTKVTQPTSCKHVHSPVWPWIVTIGLLILILLK